MPPAESLSAVLCGLACPIACIGANVLADASVACVRDRAEMHGLATPCLLGRRRAPQHAMTPIAPRQAKRKVVTWPRSGRKFVGSIDRLVDRDWVIGRSPSSPAIR